MDVRIDGRSVDIQPAAGATLEDLAQSVEQHEAVGGRIVTEIRVDGVPLEDIAGEALCHRGLDGVARVDFATDDPRRVSIQLLYEVGRSIPTLVAELKEIGTQIQSQREREAMQRFQHCLGYWLELQQSLHVATVTLGLSLEQVQTDGETVVEAFNHLIDLLSAATEAMEAGDYLGLSDTLEHEMPQVLAGVQNAVYTLIQLAEQRT